MRRDSGPVDGWLPFGGANAKANRPSRRWARHANRETHRRARQPLLYEPRRFQATFGGDAPRDGLIPTQDLCVPF